MKMKALVMSVLLAGGAFLSSPAQGRADDIKNIVGEVVRYTASDHVIVIKDTGGREVTYTLAPTLVMPSDLAVGRRVMLYTGPGANGSSIVTRVSTSVTPEGDVQRTVEKTTTDGAGNVTKETTTNVVGTVRTYEPGRTLVLSRDDGSSVTYNITRESQLPADLAVGRVVEVHPVMVTSGTPAVQTVTYTKVSHHGKKTKTVTKTVNPQ